VLPELFEQLALFGSLSDEVGLAFLRMHVHIAAGDVHVSAQHQLVPFFVQLPRPRRKLGKPSFAS
jgi:hypothetical protein